MLCDLLRISGYPDIWLVQWSILRAMQTRCKNTCSDGDSGWNCGRFIVFSLVTAAYNHNSQTQRGL